MMGTGMIVWLVVQGAVFALWAVLAFRTLFRLLAVMQARTGQGVPGVRSLSMALRVFWQSPEFGTDRVRLAWLTVVLLGLSAGFGVLR